MKTPYMHAAFDAWAWKYRLSLVGVQFCCVCDGGSWTGGVAESGFGIALGPAILETLPPFLYGPPMGSKFGCANVSWV